MIKKTGIYKIVNKINGKVYVGSSVNINKRWLEHVSYLNRGVHHSIKLQRSYNKYGSEFFEMSIIELCSSCILIEREQYWIDELNSYHGGYNATPKAHSTIGYVWTDEQRKKLSLILSGRTHSDLTKEKMSKSWENRVISETEKERLRGLAKNRIGCPSWNSGRRDLPPLTKEHKKKLSDSLIGRTREPMSDHTKQKLSESKTKTDEQILLQYPDIVVLLKEGVYIREVSKLTNRCTGTVQKVKKVLSRL